MSSDALSGYISCIRIEVYLYDMVSWRLKIKQSDITLSRWIWHGHSIVIVEPGKRK